MADVAYCPRCETPCLEDEENNAQCSKCFFSFCTHCRERRHIGDRCMSSAEKLLSLQGHEKVHPSSKANIAKRNNLLNEIISIKEMLRDAVPCPHCRTAVSRVSGCNHMLCRNCFKSFCYGCGKALDRNHTSEQCSIDQQKLAVRQDEVVKQIQKEVTAKQYRNYPCPSCHQRNPKIGNNNHIFCWACQVHYCALCRKVVRKSSEHYGPRGCKQHPTDPEFP